MGLLLLVLFTAFQTIPLPESVVGVLSPQRLESHQSLRPELDEHLPGEPSPLPRPGFLPLSIDSSRTRDSLVMFTAVLLTYVVSRNFIYTRAAAQRLAWAVFINGILLATLAMAQFFSSPHTVIYWSVLTEGAVFGPFVCKNHYPDYLSFCIGLGLALLIQEWQKQDRENSFYALPNRSWVDWFSHVLERFRSPLSVFLMGGLGFMVVSVAFSMSRGGLIAVLTAGLLTWLLAMMARRNNPDENSPGGGSLLLIPLLAVAAGLGAWFGWKPVEQRLETLWQDTRVATGDRLPLWRDLARAVPDYLWVGAGAGTTLHLETLTRQRPDIPFMYYANAHNEYLEALLEGGVIRLGLTLLILGSVLLAAIRGVLRFYRRTMGPWLLGAFFGLSMLAIHSVGDFGIHIPAVALLATVVAAFTHAIRDELEREPHRRRGRIRFRLGRKGEQSMPPALPPMVATVSTSSEGSPLGSTSPTLSGGSVVAVALSMVLASVLLAFESWKSVLVQRWGDAAVAAAVDFSNPDRLTLAAERMAGAVNVRPDDASLWNDLAAARLADALDRTNRPAAALVGSAANYLLPIDTPNLAYRDSHLIPALQAARTARNLCPTLAGPHLRLAALAELFDPPQSPMWYLERAKSVAPADAEIYYLSGLKALEAGQRSTAWADWKEALSRSSSVLGSIARATRRPWPPDGQPLSLEELQTHVLPDRPLLWVETANVLYPDRTSRSEERRSLLQSAHNRWRKGPNPSSAYEWRIWGDVCEELGDNESTLEVYRRGYEAFPDDQPLRDRLATRLEAEELYAEALPHLQWLRLKQPQRLDLRDRLDAAHHALKLQQDIQGR